MIAAALLAMALGSEQVGELERVDFIRRAGSFRTIPAGVSVPFRLTPEAAVEFKGTAADLRDLPLASPLRFTVSHHGDGRPARVSAIREPAGTVTPKEEAEAQRRKYAAFVKDRGLPARVERTSGKTLTLWLFGGEPTTSPLTWVNDGRKPGRGVRVCVANEELRTWDPVNDNEYASIVESRPEGGGLHLVVKVNEMLEGFRRGRYVRVFPDAWPRKDMPYGEQLFHYGTRPHPPDVGELPPQDYPDQFPFRTDHGNFGLAWFKLKPNEAPPPYAEHQIFGDLTGVDAGGKGGTFRPDGAAEDVPFVLHDVATVRRLNADARLADVPPGTRCCFHAFQDGEGRFRVVCRVEDEVSELMTNGAAWRVERVFDGRIFCSRQPPGVKNEQGDPEQPPDTGRAVFRVGPDAKYWRGDKAVALAEVKAGDLLLLNRSGDRPGRPSLLTEVWVGAETHKQFSTPKGKSR